MHEPGEVPGRPRSKLVHVVALPYLDFVYIEGRYPLLHWYTGQHRSHQKRSHKQARAIRLDAHGRITSPHPNPKPDARGKTRRVPFHPLYPLIVSSSVSPPSPDNSSPSCISCRSVVDRRRASFGIPEVFQSETEQNHRGGCAHSPLLPFFRSVW